MDAESVVHHCIEFGRSIGATYVEARLERRVARGLAFRNGELISGGRSPTEGIGVRLLVDGNAGFASFDRMSRELAEEAVRAAFKMAKNAHRRDPIDLGEPVSNRASWSMDVKTSLSKIDLDTMIDTAKELNAQLNGLAQYTVMINPTITDKYLVTSEGTEVRGHLEHLFIHLLLTAKGEHGSEQSFIDRTLAGGWERIREERLMERTKDDAIRLQRAADDATAVKDLLDRPVDVIVGPQIAGIIAHENVGHPSEGDRIMGREGAQAGESFWRDIRIGETRIGSEAVTVLEDPTVPNTSGFYLYDDEGVRARRRVLIKNGVANEPLLNREFGTRFGMGSNGAARASGYDREPIVRMANTFFEPGDYSFEELVEDIKLGVYMRTFQEWNIDDRRYQSKYTGSEAYLVKDGELTETLVRQPVLETTSVGLLSAADAVSREFKLDFAGTCGKGDPMQGVPVFAGGGHIRFRGIRLGGVG